MESGRCLCLGYDLILAIYAEDITDQPAGTARGDSPMELGEVADQPVQNVSQDSHRLATGSSVPARHDTIPRVYDPYVETDRAYVYPQVDSATTGRLVITHYHQQPASDIKYRAWPSFEVIAPSMTSP
jgi:hypothetical protein